MDSRSIAPDSSRTDNYEFLPAALEVLETPPAPFGRIIAITLAAFFSLAIIWASWGNIDVVVVSQGQTIPTGKAKVVQPLEPGAIRAIHVQEGDRVDKGDLLIELDPTETVANIDSYYIDLAQAKIDAAAGLALLSENPVEAFTPPDDVDEELAQTTRALIEGEYQSYRASLLAIKAEIERSEAAIRSAEIEHAKYGKTIPLIKDRLDVQEKLFAQGITQKPIILGLKQELYEQQAQLSNATELKNQNLAAIDILSAREQETRATFKTSASQKRRDSLRQIAVLEQLLKKEQQRHIYRELRAPVSGTVHQLNVTTIGAVVNSAEQLMMIIPEDAPLQIESVILNRDIGFVESGQEAEIKLEAFPFTRYGTITGELISVSDDAITHETLGPIYKAKVRLDHQSITVEGKEILLTPGMTTSVEFKTGNRKIIDFFLSPLLRYRDEAIRER